MNAEDMVLVSVDDHIIEPANMFDSHMPARFRDRAPRVVKGSDGAHHWVIEDARAPGLGLNAVVGRPPEEFGFEPVAYDQVRAGCFDVHERIADMNANGVLGSINFPSFPGFAGARFQKMTDRELALATIRAYNDWHIHEWCNLYPDRFIPLALLPLWDSQLAAAEARRMADLGARAISFPENPAIIGLPGVHSEHWYPLWQACSDLGLVICAHIGSAGNPPYPSPESPIDAWITAMPITIAGAAADWTYGAFWEKFPKLRLALSEGGIGWIPYFLERADFTQRHHSAWTNGKLGGMKPSEVFRKHVMTCFIEDDFGLRNRHDVGLEMITWECDYPHSDSTWPNCPELLWQSIKALPDDEIDLITHANAMREYGWDPIAKLGREACTVGALRAQATGVDTRPVSRGGLDPRQEKGKPVTSADVIKVLSHV